MAGHDHKRLAGRLRLSDPVIEHRVYGRSPNTGRNGRDDGSSAAGTARRNHIHGTGRNATRATPQVRAAQRRAELDGLDQCRLASFWLLRFEIDSPPSADSV